MNSDPGIVALVGIFPFLFFYMWLAIHIYSVHHGAPKAPTHKNSHTT